jgi:hypothetical protein
MKSKKTKKFFNSLERYSLSKALFWAIIMFSFFAAQQKTSWPFLRWSGIRSFSYFTDLGWVFKTADSARIIGWNIYDPQPPKDYSAYLYGSNLIRFANLFNISENKTKIIGWTLMLLFSILTGLISYRLNYNKILGSLFFFLVFISPPNQLLLERANFDLVMILILSIISFLLVKRKFYISMILLLIITLFKFYTLPLFIYLVFLTKPRVNKILGTILFLFTALLVMNDLSKIKIEFPRPSWAAFGNPIFGLYFHRFNIDLPSQLQDLIGILGLISVLVCIKYVFEKWGIILPKTSILKNPEYFTESICNIFLLTFLICFFSSTNFDYRLIYLLIPALKYINSIKNNIKMSCSLSILLILTSWLSYNSGDLQLFGDICILIWVAIFVRSILIELKDSRIFKIEFFDFIFKQLV